MYFSFDKDGRLHGFVELQFIVTKVIKFGFDISSVNMMRAYFNHGVPNGIATVKMVDERVLHLTLQDGVLHGQALIVGTVHILPVVILTFYHFRLVTVPQWSEINHLYKMTIRFLV